MLETSILGVGIVLACLLAWVGWVNAHMERTLVTLMTNLNQQHLTALEALVTDIDRLKARVKELEDA